MMYLDFYALKQTPFHATPDPQFLFLSPTHKAALGAIVHGISARQGLIAIFGEAGTVTLEGDFRDMSGKALAGARFLGVYLPLEQDCLVVKLKGPKADVAAQLDALRAFAKSLRTE